MVLTHREYDSGKWKDELCRDDENTNVIKLPTTFADLVRLFPPQAIHDEVGYSNMQEMIDRLTSLPKLTTAAKPSILKRSPFSLRPTKTSTNDIDTRHLAPRSIMLRFLLRYQTT